MIHWRPSLSRPPPRATQMLGHYLGRAPGSSLPSLLWQARRQASRPLRSRRDAITLLLCHGASGASVRLKAEAEHSFFPNQNLRCAKYFQPLFTFICGQLFYFPHIHKMKLVPLAVEDFLKVMLVSIP